MQYLLNQKKIMTYKLRGKTKFRCRVHTFCSFVSRTNVKVSKFLANVRFVSKLSIQSNRISSYLLVYYNYTSFEKKKMVKSDRRNGRGRGIGGKLKGPFLIITPCYTKCYPLASFGGS